jgi:hypothetical protein
MRWCLKAKFSEGYLEIGVRKWQNNKSGFVIVIEPREIGVRHVCLRKQEMHT